MITYKVNNPTVSCGVLDPRGICQMSALQLFGLLPAGTKTVCASIRSNYYGKRSKEIITGENLTEGRID